MVVVPAGSYGMGRKGRQRKVTIGAPFALGVYEVTFAEWDACVHGGGCRRGGGIADDERWGRGNRPVVRVNWYDARRYVEWLSAKTGETYRLPSESEWEYAARAGTDTAYSWGDEIGSGNANCHGCPSQWEGSRTAPVGSFAANAWGLHDMHGNVWEWVEDCWNRNYRGAPTDGSAWESGKCSRRVKRGGSWGSVPSRLRAAFRGWSGPRIRSSGDGFRVARKLAP